MNHTDNIKYINSILFKTYNKSAQILKHNNADNFNNKYKLRNPALHEVCLVISIEKVNIILSLEFIDIMNITEKNYSLTLDNTYFDETILTDKNEKILLIRSRKGSYLYDIETSKIRILHISKNNYCGYMLYEIVNNTLID